MTSTDVMQLPLSPVKRALAEIRLLRSRLAAVEGESRERIAVVGLGFRFPGVESSPAALHASLCDSLDAIEEIPAARWDVERYYDPSSDVPGRMYTRRGGFLPDVAGFDPEFFGISPLEAQNIDPQQRLLLEVTWEALENGGISPASLRGSRAGVFTGIAASDYARLALSDPERIDTYASTGTAFSVASGRISYLLGLQGPAISVDTACSSSLVAVHLACQSLRSRESDLALAGGVNLILSPEVTINFCQAGMLSRSERCRTFDADADGYVRSEGCGVVVLKRLSDAERDGDRILALIRGSAVNQDGRSSGLTAPNGPAQEAVIRAALAQAGLGPRDIGYVEAHGTGTALGDPIEMQALGAVFGAEGPRELPLWVGSVKTNLGHLEAAAGVAGLIKVILALTQREIPPHLHFHTPSPHIPWDRLPVAVPTAPTPFPTTNGARRAGVSSFGFSGTNAHLIVEEAPAVPQTQASPVERPLQLLTLSAPQPSALRELARRYAARLEASSERWADVCHTANTGRAHFAHRLALVAANADEARHDLQAWLAGDVAPRLGTGTLRADRPGIAFLFTGQGAQYAGMGWALAQSSPVVRAALERCQERLHGQIEVPLLELLDPAGPHRERVNRTDLTQPALFALQYALAELWRSWGIEPDLVLGHSIGEYAAAHLAGVFSLDDALRLVTARGRLMHAVQQEGMPLEDAVREQGGVLREITLQPGCATRFVSALRGALVRPDELADAGYWMQQLREPDRLPDAARAAVALDARWIVEIGVGDSLAREAELAAADDEAIWIAAPTGERPWPTLLNGIARLYAAGANLDWQTFDHGLRCRRVALPTYPFQRRRFWLEERRPPAAAPQAAPAETPVDAWPRTREAALERAELAPLDLNLASYETKWAALAELTAAVGRNTLAELGAFRTPGREQDLPAVLAATGVNRLYAPIVNRWLGALAKDGTLERTNGGYRAATPLAPVALAPLWTRAESLLADNLPLLRYLRHSASLVPVVLAGRMSPLETLFPDGSFELANGLYEHSAVLRYVNGIAATALAAFARSIPGDATIRVLEVGAGTGGTTSSLLRVLPAERSRYEFTDVSAFFFDHAREKFADYPFVRTGLFDLEKNPTEQGFAPASFEVIVGSNVVHAVRDLRSTLLRLRSLLAPGGMLLLVESTGHHAWHDISTGMIEGWQHFEDDLRTDTPLLTAEQWLEVLEAAGFEEATAAPGPGSPAEVLKQHLLMARAPGMTVPTARPASAPSATESVSATARSMTPGMTPDKPSFTQRLAEAPEREHEEIAAMAVRDCIMEILHSDPGRPPGRDARLMELGLDSLMAVRFRNLLQQRLQLSKALPSTLVFDYPTIRHIARLVVSSLEPEGGRAKAEMPAPQENESRNRETEIATLSDEAVELLLLSRLEAEELT